MSLPWIKCHIYTTENSQQRNISSANWAETRRVNGALTFIHIFKCPSKGCAMKKQTKKNRKCIILCKHSTWALFQYKDHLSRYSDSHYKDKMVMKPSNLYNWNFYYGRTASLYWDTPLVAVSKTLTSLAKPVNYSVWRDVTKSATHWFLCDWQIYFLNDNAWQLESSFTLI